MKKLSIKEKARRYDEALKVTKNLIGAGLVYEDAAVQIFPELKSEDERIRKSILSGLKYLETELGWDAVGDVDILDAYAWLEKQGEKTNPYSGISFEYNGHIWGMCARDNGVDILLDKQLFKHLEKQVEQKPADVEQKFHEGDWVVNNNGEPQFYQVSERSWPDSKIKGADDNLESFINTATLDKQYHLWTITDAKDGDVLAASDGSIFIFAGVVDYACKHYVALATDDVVKFNEGLEHCWEMSSAVHPATKEQRDALMKAIADTGTFDFKKKELKKLNGEFRETEQKPTDKVDHIVVKDFNSVFSREQVEEIDKRIEESQRRYNAELRDAMRKVEDFPMTD